MFLLFLGFFFQGAIQGDNSNSLFQLVPPFLFFIEALRRIIFKKNSFLFRFNTHFIDLIMAACVLQSFIILLFNWNYMPLMYVTMFLLAAYSLMVIAMSIGIIALVDIFLFSTFCVFLLVLISDYQGFVDSFAFGGGSGIVRYMALGAHPNLVGHNFGAAVVLSFGRLFLAKDTRSKVLFCVYFFSFLLMPIAASSRGALVACTAGIIAILIYINLNRARLNLELKWINRLALVGLAGMALWLVGNIEYVYDRLELTSKYRGFDSGFTGRFDNWGYLVDQIMTSPGTLFIGEGFRTWDADLRGYSTDNSYLNLVWEIGAPLALLWVGYIVWVLRILFKVEVNIATGVFVGFVVFMLTEAFVARYLLGIGNPASSLFLCLLLISRQFVSNSKERVEV